MLFVLGLVRKPWLWQKPLGPSDPTKIVGSHPVAAKARRQSCPHTPGTIPLPFPCQDWGAALLKEAKVFWGKACVSPATVRGTALFSQLGLAQMLENV